MSLDRLDAMATALKQLPSTLSRALNEVVQDNAYVLELDNQAQLEEGLDSNNRDITPEYTPFTVQEKQEAGQPYDRVTLRDSGDFYRSIVAQVRGEAITMEASDEKTQELQQKYGRDILGLSEEAVDEFRDDVVRPELEFKAREALGI
jgi:hypothetical protein